MNAPVTSLAVHRAEREGASSEDAEDDDIITRGEVIWVANDQRAHILPEDFLKVVDVWPEMVSTLQLTYEQIVAATIGIRMGTLGIGGVD